MGEAVSQNLVGLLDNDKGIFIDVHDQLFQLSQLPLTDHREDHFHILVGIGACSVEIGSTPVQLFSDGLSNGLVLRRDDQGHPGVVKSVHHRIDDLPADEHHHAACKVPC